MYKMADWLDFKMAQLVIMHVKQIMHTKHKKNYDYPTLKCSTEALHTDYYKSRHIVSLFAKFVSILPNLCTYLIQLCLSNEANPNL